MRKKQNPFEVFWSVAVVLTAILGRGSANDSSPPNFIAIFCDNLGYGDIEPTTANASED
jgi:hypothetical protein